jgi:hypothetical protein
MKSKLLINPLGEAYKGKEYLFGSVDLCELAERLGKKDAGKVSDKEIAAEFRRLARENLTKTELDFYNKVCNLQSAMTSRWRIWGHKPIIWLETEFVAPVDDVDFWKSLRRLARQHDATFRTLFEEKNCEYCIENYGKPNEKRHYGPNYGKIERQVALAWEVQSYSLRGLKNLIKLLDPVTDDFWQKAGVGIL